MGEDNSVQLSRWTFSKSEILMVDLKGSDAIPYLFVIELTLWACCKKCKNTFHYKELLKL